MSSSEHSGSAPQLLCHGHDPFCPCTPLAHACAADLVWGDKMNCAVPTAQLRDLLAKRLG